MMFFLIYFCVLFVVDGRIIPNDEYNETRYEWIYEETNMAIGRRIVLSNKEQNVNELLMKYKREEIANGYENPGEFPPAVHFFKSKPWIEKSKVFQFIKQMPKGGSLHIHDLATVSIDWILSNVLTRDDLYLCQESNQNAKLINKFHFYSQKPKDDCYIPVKKILKGDSNFLENERLDLTLLVNGTDPEEAYPDINVVWKRFQGLFGTLYPMVSYRPVYEDYMYRAAEEFLEDKVQYMEIRSTFSGLYELNGTIIDDPIQEAGIFKNVIEKFKKDHPEMIDIKLIYAPVRKVDDLTMDKYLVTFQKLRSAYPDLIVGFDLVAQEDLGRPLVDFVKKLINKEPDTKYFFHAGETNWNMLPVDINLVDAVLLNASRIGHGYALTKHPKIMEEVKQKGIGLELCPISNQVLKLVKDLRNHPFSTLFAEDFPIVISSDDPGLWGAKGLSYDFYMAFMGIASAEADLRTLKQLALNSLRYSALNVEQKNKALSRFLDSWNEFIESTCSVHSL